MMMKTRLFTVAMLARRVEHVGTNEEREMVEYSTTSILAANPGEADHLARQHTHAIWPERDGWLGHRWTTGLVSPELILYLLSLWLGEMSGMEAEPHARGPAVAATGELVN